MQESFLREKLVLLDEALRKTDQAAKLEENMKEDQMGIENKKKQLKLM